MITSYEISEVMLQFVVHNNWKEVLVLIDKNLVGLTRLLSTVFVTSAFVRLTPNANISFRLLSSTIHHEQNNIMVWCEMKRKLDLINAAKSIGMFGKRSSWVFIEDGSNNLKQFINMSENEEYLDPSSNVYNLVISNHLENIYSHCYLVKLVHQKWHSSSKVQNVPITSMSVNVQGEILTLKGYELKIGTFHVPPFVQIKGKGPKREFLGYTADVIHNLAEYLGFSYKYVIEPRPVFGSYHKGNWTGLVGTVYREEVDIGALYIALTPERQEAVEFSAPIYTTQNCAVIRRRRGNSRKWSVLLYEEPFSWLLWLSCGALCFLVFLTLTLTLNNSWLGDSDENGSTTRSKIADVTWDVICILFQTDRSQLPNTLSRQVVLLCFALFVLMISKVYLSLLTAHLTMKTEPKQYKNLDEALDGGKYGMTMLGQTSIYEEFKNAKYGTMQRVWKKMENDPASIVTSTDVGYEMSLKQKYVHITAEPFSIPRIRRSNCQLEILKERFLKATVGLILPKRSPLTEILSLKILSMASSGILKKLADKHLPPLENSICHSNPSMTVPVQQAIGAFAVLVIGVLGSLLCLCMEKLQEKCSSSQQSRVEKFTNHELLVHNIKRHSFSPKLHVNRFRR